MNWKSLKHKELIAALNLLIGKTITGVELEQADNVAKSVILTLGNESVKLAYEIYSCFVVSFPVQTFIVSGTMRIGTVKATTDPEEFGTEKEAVTRLEELIASCTDFEGCITIKGVSCK
jgi:hypothetical protein